MTDGANGLQPADDEPLLARARGWKSPLRRAVCARMVGQAGSSAYRVRSRRDRRPLDALPRRREEFLQEAAVAGKVFWVGRWRRSAARDRQIGAARQLLRAARTEGLRAARAALGRRRRTRVRLPPRPAPRRRVRSDPAPRREPRSTDAPRSGSSRSAASTITPSCWRTTTSRRSTSRAPPGSRRARRSSRGRVTLFAPPGSERCRCRATRPRKRSSPMRSSSRPRPIHSDPRFCSSARVRSSHSVGRVSSCWSSRWRDFRHRVTPKARRRRRRSRRATPGSPGTGPQPTAISSWRSRRSPTGRAPERAPRRSRTAAGS